MLSTEFYADFGDYRVQMTIPRGWVIGATGEEISRKPVGTDDLVEFRARGVHDFAWTTAPQELMSAFDIEFDPGRHVPRSGSIGRANASVSGRRISSSPRWPSVFWYRKPREH